MDHLSMLDAGFLQAEDADPHVSLAIGGLAIIEGPVPEHDALLALFAERVRACPRFGQRLRLHPLGLGAPEWVDDPDFDLSRHVRRAALPHPGDDEQLHAVVADLMGHRLDRDLPLWEIWVIEGLADDRWAVLTKLHHCMADGIAATHVLAGLCDSSSDSDGNDEGGNRPVPRIRAARPPSAPAWFTVNPVKVVGRLLNTYTEMATTVGRAAEGAAEIVVGLMRSGPSSLNGPVGSLRRYGAARVALSDIEQVCRRFDVTINDVALAAITESYRNMLSERGESPTADSLRTLVPVSVRSTEAAGMTDNRVSLMLPCLPVELEDPVERLRAVHARLGRAKSGGQREAGNALLALANRVPFAVTGWAVRLAMRLPQRGVVALATNVPGPRKPLQLMGRRIVGLYPVPPLAMQLRTGVAMLSYADELFFGVLADYDAVADADQLARGIEAAIHRLVSISKRRKIPRTRGPLSLVV